jgi:hypothetical protein
VSNSTIIDKKLIVKDFEGSALGLTKILPGISQEGTRKGMKNLSRGPMAEI